MLFRRIVQSQATRPRVAWLNDHALEYVIAVTRVTAVLALLAVPVAALLLLWTGDLRWAGTLGMALAIGGGTAWAGFKIWGNEEWYGRPR